MTDMTRCSCKSGGSIILEANPLELRTTATALRDEFPASTAGQDRKIQERPSRRKIGLNRCSFSSRRIAKISLICWWMLGFSSQRISCCVRYGRVRENERLRMIRSLLWYCDVPLLPSRHCRSLRLGWYLPLPWSLDPRSSRPRLDLLVLCSPCVSPVPVGLIFRR